MNNKIPERIPVYLLCGFLGSGKTTLLNRILQAKPRSAVIINEFGSTPIDQQLLREHRISLSVLSGGCLCCQVRDALVPVLKNLRMAWESQTAFDRIIIETSGIVNPAQVIETLLNHHWLSTRLSLQHIITTVSAMLDDHYFNTFPEIQAQIAWADTLIITQTDLGLTNRIEMLIRQLNTWAPAATKLTATQGDVDVNELLSNPQLLRPLSSWQSNAVLEHLYYSICVQITTRLYWEKLQAILEKMLNRYPEQLVRIKGFIYTPDHREPLLVQGVSGHLYPPARLPLLKNDDGIGRLVFISHGQIDSLAEKLKSELKAI